MNTTIAALSAFSFYRTPRLIFGPGTVVLVGGVARPFGPRSLLVTGGSSFAKTTRYAHCLDSLRLAGVELEHVSIGREPSPEMIDDAVKRYGKTGIGSVVAVGGGSVIDAAKAIAAMIPLNESVKPYLEGVGDKKHPGSTLPVIALPTTAGTGSEASCNAVVSVIDPAGGFKKSLRHENFTPHCAILDPELTLGAPRAVTVWCGFDAITQLIESFVSTKASPVTDSLVAGALRRSSGAFSSVVAEGDPDPDAHGAMSYAAFISGIALANAGLGAVHGLAGIVGSLVDAPHWALCAALLGPVTRITLELLAQAGSSGNAGLMKYADAGRLLTGRIIPDPREASLALVDQVMRWHRELEIPSLTFWKVDAEHVLSRWKIQDSKNNPVPLPALAVRRILSLAE